MQVNIKKLVYKKNGKDLIFNLLWGEKYNLIIKSIEYNNKNFDLSINKCELLKSIAHGDFIRINKNIKNDNLERFINEMTGNKLTTDYIGIIINGEFRKQLDDYIKECSEILNKEREKFDSDLINNNTLITVIFRLDRGYSIINKEQSNKLSDFENTLNKHRFILDNNILFNSYLENTEFSDYSISYTYRINMADLIEVMKKASEIISEKGKSKKERKLKEIQRIKKLFELAKETGKPQEIESYSDLCNDEKEECNIDIITIYAMPDGTKKKVREHTY